MYNYQRTAAVKFDVFPALQAHQQQVSKFKFEGVQKILKKIAAGLKGSGLDLDIQRSHFDAHGGSEDRYEGSLTLVPAATDYPLSRDQVKDLLKERFDLYATPTLSGDVWRVDLEF